MVVVYQKPDDPYLSEIVVSIITRAGQHLNLTQSRYLIGAGAVEIGGKVERNPAKIIKAGVHEFTIRDRKIMVEVRETEVL
jgi:hypothetical protein